MINIYFDGACNGRANPPLMGIGVAVLLDNKDRLEAYEVAECIGVGTNNIAEWTALVRAMQVAHKLAADYPDELIRIYGDSELIVRQFNGLYQIKQLGFRKFYEEAKELRRTCPVRVKSVSWVAREWNTAADELSKKALIPVRK